ncbi:MAG: tRNA uridine-5-carboxymethylaminomethyl(34) synthesis GTPase MnmE [Alphaproteobacteria bacterium]|nr:tRNA uridine-5-carboxymethylaminomethyl(34) synthesis GTPase MnmE [Alphaproteobacteria bacterium]MBN2675607.1 tRNA uridine-5-carboxymethylaminomethyl(34) synthesis GTPase MnmE [Alphaproteobacteria bacterium]
MNNNNTIFALSSGYGKAGVAVIRISGSDLSKEFKKIINKKITKPRYAYFINLHDDTSGLIDQCIAIYFKTPNSFTGEDVIEIHCHGAPAVVQKIFEYLRKNGARMANPGEFSQRAFYNNKMDLTEVDGLSALLDARTDKQRILALKSMTGFDSKIYESWRSHMIEISAYAAAILDYEEDELPKNIGEKLLSQTKNLYNEITTALSSYASVHAIRKGFNIVLVGETNVGKSSIFNKLVGSARAIVSDIPGTTRDVISTELDIDGYLVNLSDTAGLRESNDIIEKIGIAKTHTETENANLILRVYSDNSNKINSPAENEIIVFNKSDLNKINQPNSVSVSALTGDGIKELLQIIKEKIHLLIGTSESDLVINERTYSLLNDAANNLKKASKNKIINYDIFAEHVRNSADSIGKILGTINAFEVADATFKQLCLGK